MTGYVFYHLFVETEADPQLKKDAAMAAQNSMELLATQDTRLAQALAEKGAAVSLSLPVKGQG